MPREVTYEVSNVEKQRKKEEPLHTFPSVKEVRPDIVSIGVMISLFQRRACIIIAHMILEQFSMIQTVNVVANYLLT